MQDHRATAIIANDLVLSSQARQLLSAELTPREVLERFRLQESTRADALLWLPNLLDKRRAVWWGCLCCWDACHDQLTPALTEALRVTLDWIREPSEEHRLACYAGDEALVNCVDTCLRMAAHWSGGSMVDEDLPELLPPPDLTARLCSGAVLLAAGRAGIFNIASKYDLYLHLGCEILEGRLDWDDHTLAAGSNISVVA